MSGHMERNGQKKKKVASGNDDGNGQDKDDQKIKLCQGRNAAMDENDLKITDDGTVYASLFSRPAGLRPEREHPSAFHTKMYFAEE